jgi:hypothetical protein
MTRGSLFFIYQDQPGLPDSRQGLGVVSRLSAGPRAPAPKPDGQPCDGTAPAGRNTARHRSPPASTPSLDDRADGRPARRTGAGPLGCLGGPAGCGTEDPGAPRPTPSQAGALSVAGEGWASARAHDGPGLGQQARARTRTPAAFGRAPGPRPPGCQRLRGRSLSEPCVRIPLVRHGIARATKASTRC